MTAAMRKDVRAVAMKLESIRKSSPESFYYLRGYIDCLSQRRRDPGKIAVQARKERGGKSHTF